MNEMLRRSAVYVLGLATLASGYVIAAATPAVATVVAGEEGLRAAFSNAAETQIDLANSVTLTDCGVGALSRNSATALSLDGHGFSITQTCPSGVMAQTGSGALMFSAVTITGGNTTGAGGGINADAGAPITVTNSTMSNNTASGQGGAIHAFGLGGPAGAITVTNSTISGNTSATGGGGIWSQGGAVGISNSTISSNTDSGTFGGGGIQAESGTLNVTNSTLTGNTAGLNGGIGGGAIASAGSLTVRNSTITANTAGAFGGGGIAVGVSGQTGLVYATVTDNAAPSGANVSGSGGQGRLESFGSVVARAQGGGADCANLAGTTSDGFNFSDEASCGFAAGTDIQDGGDPLLGPLANNGGSTQTRVPQPHSPLIDAIPIASCQADGASGITTDQRGVSRPQGAGCDIGSVEAPPSPASQIAALIGTVQGFGLPKGIETSVTAKLDAARSDLAAGDTGGACSVLAAFIHEVQAQAGKKLTQAQADQLITGATTIQNAILC